MIVRAATHRDIPDILAMALSMHQETEFRDFGFDYNKVRDLVKAAIEQPHRCIFVSEVDGELTGVIAGYASTMSFSHDIIVKDQILYVSPQRRGGRAALKLMDAFMQWIDDYPKPVAAVIMATSSGMEHAENAGRFLRHYGFSQIGNVFRRVTDVR